MKQPPETYVRVTVNRFETRTDQMATAFAKDPRFVKVVPPAIHAGLGSALRRAFVVDRELRADRPFDDLLAKLD